MRTAPLEGDWLVPDELARRGSRPAFEEETDRFPPFVAGLMSGAVGGAAGLILADALTASGVLAVRFGKLLAPQAHSVHVLMVAAVVLAGLAGAGIAAIFAQITHRLRKFAALLVWSVIIFSALWTVLYAFAFRSIVGKEIDYPYGATLAGVCLFAVLASTQLLIRRRSPRSP